MENGRLTWFMQLTIIFFVYIYHQSVEAKLEPVEVKVCDGELFNATCSSGAAVVVISTAFYRRTTERLCYTMESVVMCSIDVKPYVERQCAGRRRCQMPLGLEIDAWASKVKTCQSVIDGTRSFLHVIYSCLYVYEGEEPCGDRPLAVNSRDVMLANVVTMETRRGSSTCPWNFAVSPGQAITVNLLDFAADDKQFRDSTKIFTKCLKYAVLYTWESALPQSVCGFGERSRDVHSHVGKPDVIIEIRNDGILKDFYFVLHVQISCAEYKPTDDQSVLSKTGDTVEVQCVEEDSGVPTGQNWTVMCVDGEWVSDDGRQVDCTSPNITRNINDTILEEGKIQAQQLVSSANIIAMAVGLVFAAMFIVFGVVACVRSRLKERQEEQDLNR